MRGDFVLAHVQPQRFGGGADEEGHMPRLENVLPHRQHRAGAPRFEREPRVLDPRWEENVAVLGRARLCVGLGPVEESLFREAVDLCEEVARDMARVLLFPV